MDDETTLILVAVAAAALLLVKPLNDITSVAVRPIAAVEDFTGGIFAEIKAWGDDDRWFR